MLKAKAAQPIADCGEDVRNTCYSERTTLQSLLDIEYAWQEHLARRDALTKVKDTETSKGQKVDNLVRADPRSRYG